MSLPNEWIPCLRVTGIVALEITVAIALCVWLERRARSVIWQRTIWQAAFVGMFLIAILEITGLGREIAASLKSDFRAHTPVPSSTAARQQSTKVPSLSLTADFHDRVTERLAAIRRGPSESPLHAQAPRPGGKWSGAPPRTEPEPFLQGKTLPWPELIWVLGICGALGPIGLARLFLILFRGERTCAFERSLLQRVAALSRRVGLRRRVRVFESSRLSGPVAFGILRPTIGLPKDFTRVFTPEQQEVMLAHELAHLEANDPGWLLGSDLLTALLWWHPLVWWARRRFRSISELAADEASILVADGPGLLAECLLRLAAGAQARTVHLGIGMTGSGFRSGLAQRIQRLLNLQPASWSPLGRLKTFAARILAPAAWVAAAIFTTAWISPEQSMKGDPMKSFAQTWKRSAATLALFAAFGAEQAESQVTSGPAESSVTTAPASAAVTAPTSSPTASLNTLINDARILLEAGKLDEAEAKLNEVLKQAPQNKKAATYLVQLQEQRRASTATPGGMDEAIPRENDTEQAPQNAYRLDPRLAARYGLAQVVPQAGANAPASNGGRYGDAANRYGLDPALAARYGLLPAAAPSAPPRPGAGTPAASPIADPMRKRYGFPGPAAGQAAQRGKQQVENRINQIVFNEILYDGLPLSEVVRDLTDQARRHDPDKKGINFLITSGPVQSPSLSVDPTTGAAIPSNTMELKDLPIRLRLRDVRLKDVLEAMTRVAEMPFNYSIEDFGILFSPGSDSTRTMAMPFGGQVEEPLRLQVRTFRVDTNTFVAGLESAFGIAVGQKEGEEQLNSRKAELQQLERDLKAAEDSPAKGLDLNQIKKRIDAVKSEMAADLVKRAEPGRQVQQGLRQLLHQLGVNLEVPNKAIFYNELTGILMVRATADDLEVVQAAIETLGGRALVRSAGNASLDSNASSVVTVMGKVNRSGPVALPAEQRIDLLEVIARAGDFSPLANRNKIQLTHEGATAYYKFDDLVKGTGKKVWCEPGDTVYVHESLF